MAGDFNLDISFQNFLNPTPSKYAEQLGALFETELGMVESTTAIRRSGSESGKKKISSARRYQHCRPTFGYTGEMAAGPPECKLSSYGDGTLNYNCDDAIFYRGFRGVKVSEENLLIPIQDRPHQDITHLSDHWAMLIVVDDLGESPSQ